MQKVDHANNMQPDKEMTLAEQFEACQKNKHNVIGELAESVIVSLLYDLNFLVTCYQRGRICIDHWVSRECVLHFDLLLLFFDTFGFYFFSSCDLNFVMFDHTLYG